MDRISFGKFQKEKERHEKIRINSEIMENGVKLVTVLPDVLKSSKLTADWEKDPCE